MKVLIVLGIALFSFTNSFAQDCEGIVKTCESYLKKNTGGRDFISDGQVYTAFLDREKAEFKTTFFGGTTYRITASAGSKENYIIFTIKDPEGNILFSNKNYKNSNVYKNAKYNISKFQQSNDWLIINGDDPILVSKYSDAISKKFNTPVNILVKESSKAEKILKEQHNHDHSNDDKKKEIKKNQKKEKILSSGFLLNYK